MSNLLSTTGDTVIGQKVTWPFSFCHQKGRIKTTQSPVSDLTERQTCTNHHQLIIMQDCTVKNDDPCYATGTPRLFPMKCALGEGASIWVLLLTHGIHG